jgi:hypothetical protein
MMENKKPVCQSCCLPLDEPELCGTEADGTRSKHYCVRCYRDGAFTQPDATLETILDISAKVWADKDPTVTVEQAKAQLKKKFPYLKRWCR